MDEPLIASNGVPVIDIIRFFVGDHGSRDHPAKQFERGTQCGGVYKCGSCGCQPSLMDDQAHALQCSTRSKLAIGVVLGKVPCTVKPLYVPDLVVRDIRAELVARGLKNVPRKGLNYKKTFKRALKVYSMYHHCF